MKLNYISLACSFVLLSAVQQASAQFKDNVVKKRLIDIKAKFEQLPEDKLKEFQELKAKAIESNKRGKYFTSLIEATDALAIFEDDVDLLWLSGVCHAQLGELDQAVAFYKKAMLIHPNHLPSLLNLVEVNFYHGQYAEAIDTIIHLRKLYSSAGAPLPPLMNFKYLVSLTRLAKEDPDKYGADLKKMQELYSYMDDNPYFFYAKALEELDAGDNSQGQVWIFKATTVFNDAKIIKSWNKALKDADFLADHDIMINVDKKQR